jgi:hypothetical protein
MLRATALVLALAGTLAAQTATQHSIPVPSAHASRRTGPIALDGKLDEDVWRAAAAITEFTQSDPDEGKPASERTEVRFLYDDEALYVGAKMYDANGPAGVTTRLVRRDADFNSDYFQIVIDGYHDHLSRAFFQVNPSGSKSDQIGIGTSCCDSGWDPIWQVATRRDADGWTAEIRIPFSQLRYSSDSVQTWGLQVTRWIQRRNEQDNWSFWRKTENGGPQRFGHLEGLRIARAARHLELLPYVVAKSSNVGAQSGSPFYTAGRPSSRAGMDLKYLLTSNLTLDATVNPDFGQVEVDPAVINLSAFETFFPEKRPFFIEGSGVFDFGNASCFICSNFESINGFYTRRIGRSPTGAPLTERYAYADVPDATRILGASKITGRTNNGYTVGVLDAVTGQADARVQRVDGSRGVQEVEPLANYFVGRLKRDYRDGNLVVGGMLSSVARSIDTTFAPRLSKHAELAGGDFVYAWKDRQYTVMGTAAISDVAGDSRLILAKQQSSARYFQRPDRGAGSSGLFSNRLDSSATALRGGGLYLRVAKGAGNWFWESAVNTRTPGFETNDYAFQHSADYLWTNANVGRLWLKPTSWYRTLALFGGGQSQWNYSGDPTARQYQLFAEITTPQFWYGNVILFERPAVMDDHQLRGGPVVEQARSLIYGANQRTDQRRSVVLNTSETYYRDATGGWSWEANANVAYKPTSNVTASFGPSWNDGHNVAQYVTALSDPTAATFYGSRYVIASLHQRLLALDSRLSVTFTPTMTLELYAQPFFAAGAYSDFKEYAAPRTSRFVVYGRDAGTIAGTPGARGVIDHYTVDPDGAGPARSFTFGNPDFNARSLRGNAVYRWEYRPGSVLYVAWTQSRQDVQPFGDFDFARDRHGLVATRPDNIFLVKASWWVPR